MKHNPIGSKRMKRFFFVPVLFLLLCTFLHGTAQTDAQVPVVSGDWTYVTNKRGITLKSYIGTASDLRIPYELDGKAVTRLGSNLFKGNSTLRSVIVSGSVTDIESYAFDECVNLEEVRLSYDLNSISNGLFRNCHKLKSIYIPRKITSIGASAFENCYELSEAYLMTVRSIGDYAFDNCYKLAAVAYGDRLTSVGVFAFRNTAWVDHYDGDFVFIGKGNLIHYRGAEKNVTIPWGTVKISAAFAENDSIETVFIPETVLEIGKYAFRSAVSLKSVNIPQYVTTIGSSAFEGCRSLEHVVFPNLLKNISGNAFQGCENLTEVTISKRVTSVNSMVFADCPSLTSVTLPATVTKIDKNAFTGSDRVVLTVTLNSAAEAFAKDYEIPYRYPLQKFGDFVYYRAEEGVHIAKYEGNRQIVSVPGKIGGTVVTDIDAGAFQMCGCVRRVLLPASLKTVGSWAFSYMDRLEYVVIPAGLKSLGDNVFTGSLALKEIQLPRRLQTIGAEPFDRSAETLICTREDSPAAAVLAEMEYAVKPYERCNIPADPYDTPEQCSASAYVRPAAGEETREVLAIPDGLHTLSADLIRSAGKELVLFIPADVEEIDEAILDGRSLTIVSAPGTAAESFARDHGIEFLVRR